LFRICGVGARVLSLEVDFEMGEDRLKRFPFLWFPILLLLSSLVLCGSTFGAAEDRSAASAFLLLVDSEIHEELRPWLERYIDDVEQARFDVFLEVVADEDPSEIRGLLQGISNLNGCLLVGDIPAAWYEMNFTLDEEPEHFEFPTDLYYMDLDGHWEDTDGDGLFDSHTGNIAPEIWVGRLKPPVSPIDEQIELLRRYFNKDHLYRAGGYVLPFRALIYVDFPPPRAYPYPDPGPLTDEALSHLYGNRTTVCDPESTFASDYLERVTEGWNLIFVQAHGGATFQSFIYNESEKAENVYSADIRRVNPKALFYVLASCDNARYTEPSYIAGWYVFSMHGLVAVGSTKPLYTAPVRKFCEHLGPCFGTAFLRWLQSARADAGYQFAYRGMTIIGDPLLKPLKQHECGFILDSDGDGLSDYFEERVIGTDPGDPDTDDDGVSDYYEEVQTPTCITYPRDIDNDGLSNGEELFVIGSNPYDSDTDGDGLIDAEEIKIHSTNPLDADTDGDNLIDSEEVNTYKTDPAEADTDGDGLVDGDEIIVYRTDPNRVDTDDDGLQDGSEVLIHETNPNVIDTDGDGISDGRELELGIDPTLNDTDGDELADGEEVKLGTDPLDWDTDGDFWKDSADMMPNDFLLPDSLIVVTVISLTVSAVYLKSRISNTS